MSAFLLDTFDEATLTELSAHTPNVGGAWHRQVAISTSFGRVTAGTGLFISDGSVSDSAYYNDAAPPNAEYYVEATINITNNDGSTAYLMGRLDSSAFTSYMVQLYPPNGNIVLTKVVAGSATTLQIQNVGITNGIDYLVRLEIKNATKKVFLNGTEILSDTDNAITATGFAGAWASFSGTFKDITADVNAGGAVAPVGSSPVSIFLYPCPS